MMNRAIWNVARSLANPQPKSSKFLRLDKDVLLEFIYHDQSNPAVSTIEIDNNGSHIKFLNTDIKQMKTANIGNNKSNSFILSSTNLTPLLPFEIEGFKQYEDVTDFISSLAL